MAKSSQAQLPVEMILVSLYLFLHGMIEAKMPDGESKAQ